MRVIFLDISGTLTNHEFNREQRENEREDRPRDEVCRKAVARINRIVESTGAHIVISSDWIKHDPTNAYPDVSRMLRDHGLVAEFAGHTVQPRENSHVDRGCEIRAWLDAHLDVTDFVILDDFPIPVGTRNREWLLEELGHTCELPPDDPELGVRFIHLDSAKGVQDEHVGQAVGILFRGLDSTLDEVLSLGGGTTMGRLAAGFRHSQVLLLVGDAPSAARVARRIPPEFHPELSAWAFSFDLSDPPHDPKGMFPSREEALRRLILLRAALDPYGGPL